MRIPTITELEKDQNEQRELLHKTLSYRVGTIMDELEQTARKGFEMVEWISDEIARRVESSTSIKAREALADLSVAIADKMEQDLGS